MFSKGFSSDLVFPWIVLILLSLFDLGLFFYSFKGFMGRYSLEIKALEIDAGDKTYNLVRQIRKRKQWPKLTPGEPFMVRARFKPLKKLFLEKFLLELHLQQITEVTVHGYNTTQSKFDDIWKMDFQLTGPVVLEPTRDYEFETEVTIPANLKELVPKPLPGAELSARIELVAALEWWPDVRRFQDVTVVGLCE